jgi:ADP-ribosylglycohydrolase
VETPPDLSERKARLTGCLLGTALGDALGLPAEGMSSRAVQRRFGRVDRFRLLGNTGFVSDDTEQSALVAQSLLRYPDDPTKCARDFRRALLGWFLRLPWGVGLATIKASLRILVGIPRSGVRSAGNGAAMRAAVIGVYFIEDSAARVSFVRALTDVTHTHPLAIDGALFTANLAALCSKMTDRSDRTYRANIVTRACAEIGEESLREAVQRALALAGAETDIHTAARELGVTGYVLHSVPFAVFCFIRFGQNPLDSLTNAISAGGDTDSIGAILGAWLGALHGESGLPQKLLNRIHDGPFGPTHLRALGAALAGEQRQIPGYSAAGAFARNLALIPIILAHGFRRLFP